MTTSDISLFLVALIAVLYRAWSGWREGATSEIRYLIATLFGALLAVRFWQPCSEALAGGLTFDPRWLTIAAFAALFVIGFVVAGYVVRIKAQTYQSVRPEYVNKGLGVAAGIFSGVLLGGCLFWLATVAGPEQIATSPQAQDLARFPQNLVRGLEADVAGVGPASASRSRFPHVTMVEKPVDAKPGDAPTGAVLMQRRGQVTWQ